MKRFDSAKWITENKHGKSLYEYGTRDLPTHRSSARSFSLPKSSPQKQPEPAKIMAAAFLSHDEYKDIYFGDDQEFRDEGFEYIEAFTVAPYVLIIWNDESLYSYRYDTDEEFIKEFNEMGYGMCDETGCGINEIMDIIYNSQPQSDSGDGLALLVNGKVVAQGGDSNKIDRNFQPTNNPQDTPQDAPIAGMEDEIDEGSCGYTTDTNGKKLSTPGGTNEKSITAFAQSHLQELLIKK